MKSGATRKLLLVDDEPGILTLLEKILNKTADEIHTAANGAEALEKMKTVSYDAVLSDINMPVLSGLDLLAHMRAKQMQTPFVFLSGYGDKEKTREAFRLGATDFLDKPFEPETVVDIMSKALALGQTIRTIETELESMYTSDSIPADMKIRLRQVKQAIVTMRYAVDIYKK